jgi:L-lactate dehydrogenase (cytochrome)
MRDEFETTMRMMGQTDVAQLHPGLINTTTLELMIPGAVALPMAKL